MSGPPPFPLKRARGNPGNQRLHPEPEPSIKTQCPDSPHSLAATRRKNGGAWLPNCTASAC